MSYNYTAIKKEDTYALLEKAKLGDEAARELLVSQNTGLVKSLALKYVGTGYELEDLIQIGYMGLLKSIDRFNATYDVMFSTYAVPMILGEIKRYIRDDGRIKISRQMKMDIKRMKQVRDEYYYKNGTSPKLSELAEGLGLPVERVLEIIEADDALCNLQSIDDPERKIIVLRYFRDMTQQQIANLLGISQVQVSRIEKRVLENIRAGCEK